MTGEDKNEGGVRFEAVSTAEGRGLDLYMVLNSEQTARMRFLNPHEVSAMIGKMAEIHSWMTKPIMDQLAEIGEANVRHTN